MIYGMYLSTAGAKAQSQRQDVIANNIANVDTTGFRRQFFAARQRWDHMSEVGASAPASADDPRRIGGGVYLARTYNDLQSTGAIKPSSSASHLAIGGQGFFRVRVGRDTLLTRNGAFSFDADGTLRASDGNARLLSKKGSPIKLDPNQPFDVLPDGTVIQQGRSIGQIALVQPRNPESLERRGNNLWSYDGRDVAATGQLRQYFLESSNVEPVQEMVDLIESARAFETNIHMIQLQNDTLSQLIDRVARPA